MSVNSDTGFQVGNRLAGETSPYLLQHAHNPVDWYPWGNEAFDAARKENKPVLLSIGYSTCHWCHVMAKECFEDPEVAGIMNQNLVNIKLDREERPDVDMFYMTSCLITGIPGGWPLSVFMTPEGKPFVVTTVIPKHSGLNRVGMLDLAPRISAMWHEQNSRVIEVADKIVEAVRETYSTNPGKLPGPEILDQAYGFFSQRFDAQHGGWGDAPKFPAPHNLLFLMRYYEGTGSREAMDMAEKTLRNMRLGGLFDQVGFGFHRYSTDKEWLLPHFEKMLYDQAMMIMAYSRAYQITGNEFYQTTAAETLDYACRDLLAPEEAFYSAENADSEGEEGKFYVWGESELENLLTPEELDLAKQVFNTTREGNFLDEATRERTGTNVLHMKKDFSQIARDLNWSRDTLQERMENVRLKLFRARSKRVRPSRDEKILCDQNGLMVAALCQAYQAWGNTKYLEQAEKTAAYIRAYLQTKDLDLLHCLRGDKEPVRGFLDDYAFVVYGLIQVFESTSRQEYLDHALDLNQKMLDLFWDDQGMGMYFSRPEYSMSGIRPKEVRDGAIPSGNSVALHNLAYLGRVHGQEHLLQRARDMARAFSGEVSSVPGAYAWFVAGLWDVLENTGEKAS